MKDRLVQYPRPIRDLKGLSKDWLIFLLNLNTCWLRDLRFPRQEGGNLKGGQMTSKREGALAPEGSVQSFYFAIFCRNCMKMNEFGSIGEDILGAS